MANNYIVLTNSEVTESWKFKVIEGGYNVIKTKAQTVNETLGGIDVAVGTIHEVHEYVIRLRADRFIGDTQVEDSDYGVRTDLVYFYELNNPKGTPTNVITLTDHFGDDHQVYFVGDLSVRPITTIIEGGAAIFFIPVRFRFIPE
jgi:hypothetical protein